MRSYNLPLIAVFIGFSASAFAAGETDEWRPVQQQERSFTVKYKNNQMQNFSAVFTGTVHVQRHESGGPAIPEKFKFFDDRKCHWTITPTITAQTFVILPDGERAERKDMATVYNPPFTNGGSDFVLSQLRPENCGDAVVRFNSDTNNGVAAVNREMQAVMDNAFNQILENMKKRQNVVEVSK